jgi:hypothetical protein
MNPISFGYIIGSVSFSVAQQVSEEPAGEGRKNCPRLNAWLPQERPDQFVVIQHTPVGLELFAGGQADGKRSVAQADQLCQITFLSIGADVVSELSHGFKGILEKISNRVITGNGFKF